MLTTVTQIAAGLGATHGYTIEGEIVRIQADPVVYDANAALNRSWSLQLWACDGPFNGGPLTGHKAAEVSLGNLSEFTQAPSPLLASAAFHAPAGAREFTLVLALVAAPDEVHSYASYPRPETFLLPRLRGHVGYVIDGRRITLEVAAVENPRESTNLSGTLALELWALPTPYSGGNFNGAPLAATVLGTLSGQSEWNPPPLDLAFKAPPDGTWHFCLMLREWTGTGYTTRDYTNFAAPVSFHTTPPEAGETPVTQAPFTAETSTQPEPGPLTPPPKTPRHRTTSKKSAAPAGLVSINKAGATELTSVPGLTKPMATAIVAGRPFASLEALLEVKGIGPKIFAKLKPALKL
jgi:DNA uptake protein ComE-like DNA-binding protein